MNIIFAAMKILMVCLGNICRSPLAQGILQNKVEKYHLKWTVDSAGTSNYHIGEPPHHLSQKVAVLNNIDISAQCGRQFKKEDIKNFDKIYVMDSENYIDVKRLSKDFWDEKKVALILNELYPGENRSVPDPWYGGEEGFHKVFDMLDKACEKIIGKYR